MKSITLFLLIVLPFCSLYAQEYRCQVERKLPDGSALKSPWHNLEIDGDDFQIDYQDDYSLIISLEDEGDNTFSMNLEVEKNNTEVLFTGTSGLKRGLKSFDNYSEMAGIRWSCDCVLR